MASEIGAALLSRRRFLRLGGAIALAGRGRVHPARVEAAPLGGVTAAVSDGPLSVRAAPDLSGKIVGELDLGAVVSCRASVGAWFEIRTETLRGFVHSGYVTLIADAPATTISRGSTARSLVSLTFDAEGHVRDTTSVDAGYVPLILDTLAAAGARASFGVPGRWAEANGDLVRRMVDEGHHFVNHTFSHPSFTGADSDRVALLPSERLAELEETEAVLRRLTGVGAKPWFRPPYGDQDDGVLRDLGATGFAYSALWTFDSGGYIGLSQDEIAARVVANHGNGFIYLFHTYAQSQDGPALAAIIDGLRALGYDFGSLPELLD